MNDNLRIVCLSDTHGLHRGVTIPNGDVLIHAGDFSGEQNSIEDVIEFNRKRSSNPILDFPSRLCSC
jgi:hypothetical protein